MIASPQLFRRAMTPFVYRAAHQYCVRKLGLVGRFFALLALLHEGA